MDKRIKYSIKQKHAIVRSIVSGRLSTKAAAREVGCHKSAIQRWVIQYKAHGVKGFTVRNGHYEGQFKLSVVRSYLKNGLSLNQVATHFKIPNAGLISQWIKIYKGQGALGLQNRTRGRKRTNMTKKARKKETTLIDPAAQKLAEMQQELDYLRAENAFLKKLRALVQQKEAAKAQARRPKSSGN